MTTTENTRDPALHHHDPRGRPRRPARAALARTRFAAAAPGDAWAYGTPTAYLRDMVERWRSFDWRAQEHG